jgi:Family of unknown function (DUF6275)
MGELSECEVTTTTEWRILRFDERCYFYPERDCPGWASGTTCGRMGTKIPEKEENMGEEDYLTQARWIVVEYFNRNKDLDDASMVLEDTEVSSAMKRENGDWRVAVRTKVPDDLDYEITYEGDAEETHLRVYRTIYMVRLDPLRISP